MTTAQELNTALEALEAMTDTEFSTFMGTLPKRVQLLIRGGIVDWRTTLPAWYIQYTNLEKFGWERSKQAH
jgi:hypothetical protein